MPHPVALVRTVAGPWGPFHLGATSGGIAAAETAPDLEPVRASLARRLGGDVGLAADADTADPWVALLDRAERIVTAMLAGRAPDDDIPFDLRGLPSWDQRVLAEVAAVPWGRTASYAEIARRVGSPRAARAVGGAVGRSPMSVLLPCHRVIASDGTLGGYGSDTWESAESALDRKAWLLLREGVTVPRRSR